MMTMTFVLRIEFGHPGIQRGFDLGGVAFVELAFGLVSPAVVRTLQKIEQRGNRCSGDHGRLGKLRALWHDAPDAATGAESARITQRILRVAFDRVIPVADVEVAAWTDFHVGGDETEVGREDEVAEFFLLKVVIHLDPLVHLNVVRRFVAGLDEAALQLLRVEVEIDELLAAGAGIRGHFACARMLLRIRRIRGVKGAGENRVTGDVVAPIVKSNAPGIRARVTAENRQLLRVRAQAEPARVIHAHRPIGRLDL